MSFRNFAITAIFACTFVLSIGQTSKIASAYNSIEDAKRFLVTEDWEDAAFNLKKGVEYITPALTHEKTRDKEKTWRYRGQIYELIARYYDKPGILTVDTDPFKKGVESFKKALELDPKGDYEQENKLGLAVIQNALLNMGITSYNAGKYDGSYDNFSLAANVAEYLGVVDTTGIYNAGLAAEKAGKLDLAVVQYEKSMELGYNGASMYSIVADIHKKLGNNDKARAAIKAGLEKYPGDKGLLIDDLNMDLNAGDMNAARTNLEKAIAADPTNPVLHFSLGSVLDGKGDYAGAENSYMKALELKEDYFDAQYNLGALYFNKAVEMNTEANSIPPQQIKAYDAAMDKVNAQFDKSMPYLERARELNGEDFNTLGSLMQLYARQGKTDKYNEIKAILGN